MDVFFDNMRKEKRSTYLVQIRKENTEKLFAMKRISSLKISELDAISSMKNAMEENISVILAFFLFLTKNAMISQLEQEISRFFENYSNNEVEKTCKNIYNCRRKIASSQNKEHFEDIEKIINSGMLKVLVEILNSEYNLQRATLLEETSWCISNMAGSISAHVKELIEAKCVDAMIRLFLLQPSYCIIDNVDKQCFFLF